MLVFPSCKINLGLHIIDKRPNSYHSIETVFYPINWCDALEVVEDKLQTHSFTFSQTGLTIGGNKEDNLIYKAWKLILEKKSLPPIKVHLHKNIPMGAGLGGGSSDAAFFINLLNEKFALNFTLSEKLELTKKIGADCSFFIKNFTVLASGIGHDFVNIKLDLSNYFILIVFPNIISNTKEAYDGVTPKIPIQNLSTIIENYPVTEWKNHLINDFETSVFKKFPQIEILKENLYNSGAIYACMSGSGSCVFGIYSKKPEINFDSSFSFYLQTPKSIIS